MNFEKIDDFSLPEELVAENIDQTKSTINVT